jgi:hypothetical protein
MAQLHCLTDTMFSFTSKAVSFLPLALLASAPKLPLLRSISWVVTA